MTPFSFVCLAVGAGLVISTLRYVVWACEIVGNALVDDGSAFCERFACCGSPTWKGDE